MGQCGDALRAIQPPKLTPAAGERTAHDAARIPDDAGRFYAASAIGAVAAARACSRSAMMSSMCSMPTERRT
jgi:hypothetical protein